NALSNAELASDFALQPELVGQPRWHGVQKASQAARRGGQVAGQQALEFEHRLLVEDDMIDVVDSHARIIEAPADGVMRERRVALDAGKALFLGGIDDLAVVDERGGRIVIEGGDAEDADHQRRSVDSVERFRITSKCRPLPANSQRKRISATLRPTISGGNTNRPAPSPGNSCHLNSS